VCSPNGDVVVASPEKKIFREREGTQKNHKDLFLFFLFKKREPTPSYYYFLVLVFVSTKKGSIIIVSSMQDHQPLRVEDFNSSSSSSSTLIMDHQGHFTPHIDTSGGRVLPSSSSSTTPLFTFGGGESYQTSDIKAIFGRMEEEDDDDFRGMLMARHKKVNVNLGVLLVGDEENDENTQLTSERTMSSVSSSSFSSSSPPTNDSFDGSSNSAIFNKKVSDDDGGGNVLVDRGLKRAFEHVQEMDEENGSDAHTIVVSSIANKKSRVTIHQSDTSASLDGFFNKVNGGSNKTSSSSLAAAAAATTDADDRSKNEDLIISLVSRLSNADSKYFNMFTSMADLHWRLVVSLNDDATNWNTRLTDPQRKIMTHVLTYFSVADDVVLQNLADNVIPEITELSCFNNDERHDIQLCLSYQGYTECVHKKTYGRMINIAMPDRAKLIEFLRNTNLHRSMDMKIKWAERFMDRSKNRLIVRLLAFACVEQIHFSTSFLTIFWLKSEHGDPLPGMSSYNEYINRDEAKHFKLFCMLILDILASGIQFLTKEEIHEVIMSAVDAEIAFFTEAIPQDIVGFKLSQVIEYIKCMGNTVSLELHAGLIYDAKNYFPYMGMIDQDIKVNFLEPVKSTMYRENHIPMRRLQPRPKRLASSSSASSSVTSPVITPTITTPSPPVETVELSSEIPKKQQQQQSDFDTSLSTPAFSQ